MVEQVYPCPVCGKPRVTRISHTARNPERAFLTCTNRCEGSFQWVDTLPKYELARPMVTTTTERNARIDAKMQALKVKDEPKEFVPNPIADLSFLDIAPTTPTEKPVFIPSKYHPPIFHAFETRERNVTIESTAGSGKTSTIREGTAYLRPNNKSIALAFGKDIAAVLKEVVPSYVEASTTHALALANIRSAYPKMEREPNWRKTWDVMNKLDESDDLEEVKPNVNRLVSLLQQTLREPTDTNMDWLVEHYGLEINGDREKVLAFSKEVFKRVVEDKSTYEFDNLIYWCATDTGLCRKFDDVLVDESQDQCPTQIQMLLNCLNVDGRIYAFGDRNQSVMGFRGADVYAMDNIVKATDAIQLPLSISYRCAVNIVKKCQTLVPQMEWRDNAPMGVVDELTYLPRPKEGDFILCRINAPLVPICLDLIRQGIPAKIKGRELTDGLISLLLRIQKKVGTKDLRTVLRELERYVSAECLRLQEKHRETQALGLRDRMETLLFLSEGFYSTGQLIARIKEIFSEDKAPVTLMSCHASKGLEANDVYIIKPELMPFKRATQDWELVQEQNLCFVAWSRAKTGLHFVTG